MKNSSIFNEVFGPVMVGPSSSHTAGPARIGKMCRAMLPDEPADIEITFDQQGSFAATYEAQGSNYGFIGGLIGLDISDENIRRSLVTARERGVVYNFVINDIPGDIHPNFALIKVKTVGGYELEVEAASTGGGMFEIQKYNGRRVSLKGDCHEFIYLVDQAGEVQIPAMIAAAEIVLKNRAGFKAAVEPGIVNIKTDQGGGDLKKELDMAVGIDSVYLPPVLPIVKRMDARLPFSVAAEALNYARAENIDQPWRLAAAYESALSGRSVDDVLELMAKIAGIMRASAHRGLAGGYKQRGFLPPQSPTMNDNIMNGRTRQVDLGLLNKAALWSCAVLDYDICLGVVVAAPTGGSSGVLPGAVISVGEDLGLNEDEISKALLVGGMVGVFIDHQATFAAETAACQAEIGAGSAMAAAAVVQLLGGTADQAFKSAALALQNMLGLICDPVAGVGNVPCVSRNATGVANALVSANMVMAGFDPCIPLDEVIQTMKSVGAMLPPELRCTGRGGLCLTKTAARIAENIDLTPSA